MNPIGDPEPVAPPTFAEPPEKHLGLVFEIARKYEGLGLDIADLVGAGTLGLVQFAVRFEPARKRKFATGASHYIRGAILNEIRDHARLIRIPPEVQERMRRVASGRISRSDLAHSQQESLADAERAAEVRGDGTPDHDGPSLGSILATPGADQPGELAAINEQDEAVAIALSLLPPRCEDTIRRHFWGGESLTKIAATRGINVRTVEHQKARAIRLLSTLVVPPGQLTQKARTLLTRRARTQATDEVNS